MNLPTAIVLGVVALLVILAVIYLISEKKKGRSVCSGCSGNCSECMYHHHNNKGE